MNNIRVAYRDRAARRTLNTTIQNVPTDGLVNVTGTITKVRHHDGTCLGRTSIDLSHDGATVEVTFDADAMQTVEPVIRRGTTVTVYGLVVRTAAELPASVEGFNAGVPV